MTYDASDWAADAYDRMRDHRDELRYTREDPKRPSEVELEAAEQFRVEAEHRYGLVGR